MITLAFGALTLSLRNPDFGDKASVEVRKINRKTRGGDLVVYRDPNWPKNSLYEYKFSFLKQEDVILLLEFMRDTLGQKITITDYNGVVRQGVIITPDEATSQQGREDFQAGFQFQVEE